MTSTPLWSPAPERAEQTLLHQFIASLNSSKPSIDNYDDLWAWSCQSPEVFWTAVWDFTGLVGDPGESVFNGKQALIEQRFFPDGKVNYAENLLRHRGEAPAIVFQGEDGRRQSLSFDELHGLVSRLQQALKDLGVVAGDRVAGYVPHAPGTIVAMLAATSLGAIWSSCSPDFGLNGVMDRFGQIEPKVLFCADGYHYNGKSFSSIETALSLAEGIASIEKVVVLPFIDDADGRELPKETAVHLEDLLKPYREQPVEFVRVSFSAPLFIMFSSGTTGLPKCIVHSVGGTILQHLKEHQLQCDIQPGDRLFYFTTCGWMMWNWQVSALASGATLVLFDGSPFYPGPARLSQLVAQEQVTHFGTSAKYLDACAKAGVRPMDTEDFSSLRCILSTGSPLSEDGFHYVYRDWKQDVCLSSIAGGTDILGCFVGGNPIGPVYAGECQKRHLGMNVAVFNSQGQAVIGEPGELVCLSAHPSMPVGFWNDDGSRYKAAYFESYDNVWCHGDWVELTERGGMIFHGRSDATLNPGGVRIGTAEIYRRVEGFSEVAESLAIGQQWDNDVRVVLFVRMQPDQTLTEDLIARLKKDIRQHASPRHVPARILTVTDIPRTRSGKISELAVRDVVHGRQVKNVEALANPEALEQFKHRSELAE